MANFSPALLIPLHTLFLEVNKGDDEFNLFLFTLLILGLIFICVSVIIGIILVALCLLVVFGFIGIGALSVSALIGFSKKSFTAGFRYFVVLFSSVSMTFIGAGAFWLLNRITHWFSYQKAVIAGAATGLVSGLIAGICLAYLIRKLSVFLKEKLEKRRLTGKSL